MKNDRSNLGGRYNYRKIFHITTIEYTTIQSQDTTQKHVLLMYVKNLLYIFSVFVKICQKKGSQKIGRMAYHYDTKM